MDPLPPAPLIIASNRDVDVVLESTNKSVNNKLDQTVNKQPEATDIESIVNIKSCKSFELPADSVQSKAMPNVLFDSKINKVIQDHTRQVRSKSLTVLNFSSHTASSTPVVYNVHGNDVAVVPSLSSNASMSAMDRISALTAVGVRPIAQKSTTSHHIMRHTAEDIEQLIKLSTEAAEFGPVSNSNAFAYAGENQNSNDIDHIIKTDTLAGKKNPKDSHTLLQKLRGLHSSYDTSTSTPNIAADASSKRGRDSLKTTMGSLPLLNRSLDARKHDSRRSLVSIHNLTAPKPSTLANEVLTPSNFGGAVITNTAEDIDNVFAVATPLDSAWNQSVSEHMTKIKRQQNDVEDLMTIGNAPIHTKRSELVKSNSVRFTQLSEIQQMEKTRNRSISTGSYSNRQRALNILGVYKVSETEMRNAGAMQPIILVEKDADIDKLLDKGELPETTLADASHDIQCMIDTDGKADLPGADSKGFTAASGAAKRDIDKLISSSAVLALYPKNVAVLHNVERSALEPASLLDGPEHVAFLSPEKRQISVSSRNNLFSDEDHTDSSLDGVPDAKIVIPEPSKDNDSLTMSKSSSTWSQASTFFLSTLFGGRNSVSGNNGGGLSPSGIFKRRSSSPSKIETAQQQSPTTPPIPNTKILTASDSFHTNLTAEPSTSKLVFPSRKQSNTSLFTARRYSADSQNSSVLAAGDFQKIQVKEPVKLAGDMDDLLKWSDSAYKTLMNKFGPRQLSRNDQEAHSESKISLESLKTPQSENETNKTAISIGNGNTVVLLPNSAKNQKSNRSAGKSVSDSRDFDQLVTNSMYNLHT